VSVLQKNMRCTGAFHLSLHYAVYKVCLKSMLQLLGWCANPKRHCVNHLCNNSSVCDVTEMCTIL